MGVYITISGGPGKVVRSLIHLKKIFYWSVVDLQCCVNFCYTAQWVSYECASCSVSDSLWPYGPQTARLLCSWDFPGKNSRVGCHFLLQGIFLTQGSNPGLLHWRWILYQLSHRGSYYLNSGDSILHVFHEFKISEQQDIRLCFSTFLINEINFFQQWDFKFAITTVNCNGKLKV